MSFASFKLLSKSGIPNRFRTVSLAPSGTGLAVVCGASGNGIIVAGGDGLFYKSENGVGWEAGDGFPFWDAKSIAYGNNKFVAVGYVGGGGGYQTAYYSTNGINWVVATMPSSQQWTSVTYGNGKFVAISGTNALQSNVSAYSTDGINWTQSILPATARWERIVYGGDRFISATDTNFTAAYSLDGINWNSFSFPNVGIDPNKFAYGLGKFVGVEGQSSIYDNRVVYSTDGVNWNVTTALPQSLRWGDIAYGTIKGVGYFFTVGENKSTGSGTNVAAYSTDGINWKQTTLPYTATWSTVFYGNGKFFMYADSGASPPNSLITTI